MATKWMSGALRLYCRPGEAAKEKEEEEEEEEKEEEEEEEEDASEDGWTRPMTDHGIWPEGTDDLVPA